MRERSFLITEMLRKGCALERLRGRREDEGVCPFDFAARKRVTQ